MLLLLLCAHLREKAIAVITGGIAEMFVSRNTETLTCLRKGFVKIALRVSSIYRSIRGLIVSDWWTPTIANST